MVSSEISLLFKPNENIKTEAKNAIQHTLAQL